MEDFLTPQRLSYLDFHKNWFDNLAPYPHSSALLQSLRESQRAWVLQQQSLGQRYTGEQFTAMQKLAGTLLHGIACECTEQLIQHAHETAGTALFTLPGFLHTKRLWIAEQATNEALATAKKEAFSLQQRLWRQNTPPLLREIVESMYAALHLDGFSAAYGTRFCFSRATRFQLPEDQKLTKHLQDWLKQAIQQLDASWGAYREATQRVLEQQSTHLEDALFS
ncbi:MAG: hypothetical protein H6728_00255 [Myxococcales bacterium]|nr:hypothetical protein [Myxococcales bacterium]MCB9641494.1 hypothetical protein [Myxococcales bacterium]